MSDTIQATFDKYFGIGKNPACGTETRLIKGELTTVVVDQAKYDAWLAAERAKADRANAELQRRIDRELAYYPEEG